MSSQEGTLLESKPNFLLLQPGISIAFAHTSLQFSTYRGEIRVRVSNQVKNMSARFASGGVSFHSTFRGTNEQIYRMWVIGHWPFTAMNNKETRITGLTRATAQIGITTLTWVLPLSSLDLANILWMDCNGRFDSFKGATSR